MSSFHLEKNPLKYNQLMINWVTYNIIPLYKHKSADPDPEKFRFVSTLAPWLIVLPANENPNTVPSSDTVTENPALSADPPEADSSVNKFGTSVISNWNPATGTELSSIISTELEDIDPNDSSASPAEGYWQLPSSSVALEL